MLWVPMCIARSIGQPTLMLEAYNSLSILPMDLVASYPVKRRDGGTE